MLRKLVGFLLRKLPRTLLQRISKPIFKIISIFYYGNKVKCPICKKSFKEFFPYGRETRNNALCTNCLSLERHRLIYLYLEKETSIFKKKTKLLHIAPEACLINIFKRFDNIEYITADLNSPLADIKMDIHNMPFKEKSFDLILCNHVLEHVENDIKALEEIKRVLKMDGIGIVQVPFYNPIPKETLEDKSVTSKKERELLYGQSDHVRKYGKDYRKRLESTGLKTKLKTPNSFLFNADIIRHSIIESEEIFIVSR
ncbi:MAG: class I SAM-dependent methyltransferase [Bacteroidota bacterium]|nr:class I SAM-dependent methyltransferase [Bacteroidota bacterium]